MQRLPEIIRRNRAVIMSITAIVILPSAVLCFLAFRAVRTENVQQQFQQRQRQRQIALVLEAELKKWLFSGGQDGAISQALLRFHISGEQIVFPSLAISIPPGKDVRPVPFSLPNSPVQDQRTIEEIYYPRIQAFLRDLKSGRNSGAQYFRRLKAMVVQIPATNEGYVLSSTNLTHYSQRKLDELTAPETFRATFLLDESRDAGLASAEAISLDDFTFFQIGFGSKEAGRFDVRKNFLLYAIVLLTLITISAVVFVYRGMAQEMAMTQLRADFVSAVSHEFRTPLSSMLALLERLELGRVVEPGMQQRYYQALRQEAHRLGLLVEKLLDFAQLEEDKKKFSFERLQLSRIIDEAVKVYKESAFHQRIEQACVGMDTAINVVADRTAIVQCVQNLIENALKYSPPDVKVLARYGMKNGTPFIEVIDQGIGIPVGDREKIFEKFYRAENARASNVQGTGIGLTLVKRIMEIHGGSVGVTSIPGQGSCFSLMFSNTKDALE